MENKRKMEKKEKDKRISRSQGQQMVDTSATCHSSFSQPDQDTTQQPPLQPRLQKPDADLPRAVRRHKTSGYNSDDEYESVLSVTEEEWNKKERRFVKMINDKGWVIKQMHGDGACLFRAVADQVFGDQEMHSWLRNECMDFLLLNEIYYKEFIGENIQTYVKRKRNDSVHGNHLELQALSDMLSRAIEVYSYSTEPLRIIHGLAEPENGPIRLSYHRYCHYNSIVEPNQAGIGVGPDLLQESEDTSSTKGAVCQSGDTSMELKCGSQTDTDEDNGDHAVSSTSGDEMLPLDLSLPKKGGENMDLSESKHNFLTQVPPEVLGLTGDENESMILAEVLAKSQEEYLDSLKKLILKESPKPTDGEPSKSPEDIKPSYSDELH